MSSNATTRLSVSFETTNSCNPRSKAPLFETCADNLLLAVLSQGNRAKPGKFRYVKPVGSSYRRYSDRRRKVAFSTTALSFDTTSPANPDEYRHMPHIIRKPQTVGYIFAADSICASPSIFQNNHALKPEHTHKTIPLEKQYLTQNGYSRSFKVVCFNVDETPLLTTYSDIIILVSYMKFRKI